MSDTKWTPGPWVSGDDPEGDYPNKISIHTEDNFYIAVLDNSSYEGANAHLIAAAPELYEALNSALSWMKFHRDNPGTINHNAFLFEIKAKKILEKARGETK